jgi:O-antigen biosynthesis protein
MPTANRRRFLPAAIALFTSQTFEDSELIIVDDGSDEVSDLVPNDPRIRYERLPMKHDIGTKRNIACELARGDLICHWDDDDWYASQWLQTLDRAMTESPSDIFGIDSPLFVDCERSEAWQYSNLSMGGRWLCGATLCYRKEFWRRHRFASVTKGEDTRFVLTACSAKISALKDFELFVGRIHPHNTCEKRPSGRRWHPWSLSRLRSIVGSAWDDIFGGINGVPSIHAPINGAAAIALGKSGEANGVRSRRVR